MNNCLLFFQNDNKNDNLLHINLVNQKLKKSHPNIIDQLRFFKINKKRWNICTKFNFDTKKVLFFENYIVPQKKFAEISKNDITNFSAFPLSIDITETLFSPAKLKSFFPQSISSFSVEKSKDVDSKMKIPYGSLGKSSSLFFCKTSENNLNLILNLISSSPFLPICVVSPDCKTIISKKFVEKLKKYQGVKNSSFSEKAPKSSKENENNWAAEIKKQKIEEMFFYFFFKKKIFLAAAPFYLYKKKIKGES